MARKGNGKYHFNGLNSQVLHYELDQAGALSLAGKIQSDTVNQSDSLLFVQIQYEIRK